MRHLPRSARSRRSTKSHHRGPQADQLAIEGPDGAAAILKLNPSTLRSRIKKLRVERSRDSTS